MPEQVFEINNGEAKWKEAKPIGNANDPIVEVFKQVEWDRNLGVWVQPEKNEEQKMWEQKQMEALAAKFPIRDRDGVPIPVAVGVDPWHQEKKAPQFAAFGNDGDIEWKEKRQDDMNRLVEFNAKGVQENGVQFMGQNENLPPVKRISVKVDYNTKILSMKDLRFDNIVKVNLEIIPFAEAIAKCLDGLFPNEFEIHIN